MTSLDEIAQLKRRLAAVEERLRESETRHSLLIDNWAQAVWETDSTGVVVADSPSWRAYTGQALDEWLGWGWLDAIHPEDRAYAERQWREVMAAGGLVNAEFRLRAPDGGWRWTNVRAVPLLDAKGRIEKWAGVNINIDARKRAEAALQESEETFRTVFESIDHAFVIQEIIRDEADMAIDMRYVRINAAFTLQTGLGPEIVGKLVSEVMPDVERFFIDIHDRVARTGTPERFESYNQSTGRWYDAHITAVGGQGRRAASVFEDVSARKLAEKALRDSEERQAFLLRLSDALRPLSDGHEIRRAAMNVVGEQLGVDCVVYGDISPDTKTGVAPYAYTRGDFPSIAGTYDMDAFGPAADACRAGETFVLRDVENDPAHPAEARAPYRALGVRAIVAVPLMKGDRWVSTVIAYQREPRQWAPEDVDLLRETLERTWDAVERALAEDALRESEERFQQFAQASKFGLWIRNAQTLTMEYASPAIWTIYGVEQGAFLGDISRWAALIVPEDREGALAHMEQALQGETVVQEFRIQRLNDGAFRWIRNTDFPLLDQDGRVMRFGGIAEDITEVKLVVEHQGVLLAELQHRVRNIMAIIRSMVRRTADGAVDIEDYRSLLEGRLLALARVQVLLTRESNTGGSLRDIIESEVSAQAHRTDQFVLEGRDIRLSPKAVEVLTLAFHELATNAVKYGAFSTPQGRLRVSWSTFEKRARIWLALDWTEEGAPHRPPPTRRGFGSDLIEGRIPYELGGTGKVVIAPGGAHCRLELPLKEGESILETDAPMPTKLFGGTLDMTDAPELTGHRILVVEDDYYMAGDTAAALRGAKAEVLGPYPTEEAARNLLDIDTPTHAVLDLNLGGGGPRFEIAHALKARAVPFIFLTGYDPEVIPADLEDVVRLQKPVAFRKIVEAVSQLRAFAGGSQAKRA